MIRATAMGAFLSRHGDVARARLTGTQGSTPRDAGAEMHVSATAEIGTIGGGRLEHMVIAEARAMLARGDLSAALDVALGPEIGQCCGGRAQIAINRLSPADRTATLAALEATDAALPKVYILGAGHVGRALAGVMALMPVQTILIDSRSAELALCQADVAQRLSALPEHDIQTAPPGSAFIVLTHDHGLDFLLTSAAVQRGDAAYIGMIGSDTKRAGLQRTLQQQGLGIDPVTCPIGARNGSDKRPEVIALHVATEVMDALAALTLAAESPALTGAGHARTVPLAREVHHLG